MVKPAALAACAALLVLSSPARLQGSTAPAKPPYEPELARSLGADENGMKSYVLVILKTGPNQIPAGPDRDEMFKGHFANMNRLAAEGKLAVAGPFDGADGWRGLFIFAVADIDEAKKLTATDPVIVKGEMVAEYHKYYGSAALMLVRDGHDRVSKKRF